MPRVHLLSSYRSSSLSLIGGLRCFQIALQFLHKLPFLTDIQLELAEFCTHSLKYAAGQMSAGCPTGRNAHPRFLTACINESKRHIMEQLLQQICC